MNRKRADCTEKHEFALYVESLSSLMNAVAVGGDIIFSDEKLVHRMMHIVRLNSGDTCILFDRSKHVTVVIKEYVGKKQVNCVVYADNDNIVLLRPYIYIFVAYA